MALLKLTDDGLQRVMEAVRHLPPPARSQAMSSIDLTAGQMLEASAGKSEAGSGASNAAPAPPAHTSPRV